MKRLFKILLLFALLGLGTGWAALPEYKGTVCDGEFIKQSHAENLTRLKKASDTLYQQYYAINPDWKAAQVAVDNLSASIDYLAARFHPSNQWLRPIPSMMLQQLQNDEKSYGVQKGAPAQSTREGLQRLKKQLTGANRKRVLAMLTTYVLSIRTLYDEALIGLANEADSKQSKECKALKARTQAKRNADAVTLPGKLKTLGMNLVGIPVMGFIFGFLVFMKSRKPGWILFFPLAWTSSYVVGFLPYLIWSPLGSISGVLMLGLFVYFAYLWHKRFQTKRPQTHGSAAWASAKETASLGRVQPKGYVLADSYGLTLGRMADAKNGTDSRLRYTGHVLTCAPTGAGKGIGAVIPNLLEYPGSVLVLDIKGENYAVTHEQRAKMGHAVYVLDPFSITGGKTHAYNWLDRLNPDNPNVVSESAMLADMLVVPGDGELTYWDEAAKDLLRGLLVYVACLENPNERHMGTVRLLLTSGEKALRETLDAMTQESKGFGLAARTAHAFLSKAEKDRSGVLSSAIRHTAFLDDPRIVETLTHSDFNLDDLKNNLMTVYVAMPPSKISAYHRYMRALVGLSLAAITENPTQPECKVVFFLDEFAQLGRMSAIEDAISLVRGYGAAFWIFVQDLSQLKGVYPKWQTFLANTAKQFFGTADLDTARYVSQTLGEYTEVVVSSGRSQDDTRWTGGTSQNLQYLGRPLLTPDEVMRMGAERPIVLIAGERPYLLKRLNYLQDEEYQGLAGGNPYHVRERAAVP